MRTKQRRAISKATRESVLKEFNHRCALCGKERPQLHHIDENPANGDPMNLIPLCANCHLIDQHDATNTVPREKLSFFRRYKHRYIMKPQFNAIFRRMTFLGVTTDADADSLQAQANSLMDLVRNMEMGSFYARELEKLLDPKTKRYITILGATPVEQARHDQFERERTEEYRNQLRENRAQVEQLIVEMLDYQPWPDSN